MPKIPTTPKVPTTSESPHDSEVEASTEIQSPHTPPITQLSIWNADSGLSDKVRRACEIARGDGYRYIWIDSCCINKDSSSELSEAINSMFNWYRASQICYAFLVDVPSDEDPRAEDSMFRESRWFQRGWTLQELVAPLLVVFLSKDWKGLGTKEGLAETIQEITSIDIEILTHKRALSDESVANRMGWASRRETTRVEDEAYSLLGIFDITMSTLYGEGRYAFRRLQEEILRRIPDQSLFAWGSKDVPTFPTTSCEMRCFVADTRTLLASSPTDFTKEDNGIIPTTGDSIASLQLPVEEYTHTPYGIRIQLCLLPLQRLNPNFKISVFDGDPRVSWYLAILRAQKATNPQGLLGQLCYLRQSDKANIQLLYREPLLDEYYDSTSGLYELSPDIITRVEKLETHVKTVYLPHPKPSELVSARQLCSDIEDDHSGVHRLSLTVPMWVQDALRVDGFTLSNIQGPTEHDPNSFSFDLLHASFNIHILYRHTTNPPWLDRRDVVVIKACAWILPPGNEGLCTTTIQLSPPSDSATWVQDALAMTVPSQRLVLRTGFGDGLVTVLLSLGLDLTAPYRYNLRVNVAPHIYADSEVGTSACAYSKDILPDCGLELELPYKTLDFILPGSARRALEMKAYSVKAYSVRLSLEPSLGDTHSHSLTLSTDADKFTEFAVVVKYLQVHTLGDTVLARSDLNPDFESDPKSKSTSEDDLKIEKIVIVARVTLVPSDDGFETVRDGPHVVVWHDRYPWNLSLGSKDIVLTTPSGDSLALQLGFDLAWFYEYYLHIDIMPAPSALQPPDLSSTPTRISRYNEQPTYLVGWAHRGISLTLPAHVSRALQAQGFQVLFERLEGGGASGDSDHIHHLLTLSHSRAGFDIIIKYFHDLTIHYPEPDSDLNDPWVKKRYPLLLADPQLDSDPGLLAPTAKASVKRCRQKLTFKASVQTFDSRSAPSRPAVHPTPTTEMHWEERLKWGRAWAWEGRRRDITLTLPTGRQLVLRLGFNLVWYSEYCPVVEINPRRPLPLSRYFPSNGSPMPEYERGDDGMEYVRQTLTQSTEPGVGQPEEAPDDDSEPLAVDPRDRRS
ncbi:hypothetical protein GSI_13208 [Ganoderma sinense ZZ0214-1]|uniref:Uncharacterized protein n=1 Tax=Ganoderma sinense ZZ0214-1 TaxID=1077348 RepID=A0A2G8RUZ8_9APHY|nr:hypothetical protein GSI_13208 [Ganoderma sinense ZZ0214-1]